MSVQETADPNANYSLGLVFGGNSEVYRALWDLSLILREIAENADPNGNSA